MQTERAYEKFQMKVNENYESSKIAVDRGRFVILANESQNKMMENILDRKSNDELRYIQKVLVKDKKILKDSSTETTDRFPLPTDYFDFSSAYTKAQKGNCLQKINLYEIKDDNSIEILSDEFNKPSFIARETPFTFSNDSVIVFKEDFKNTELFLSYYRYPVQIKLIDEENPESGFDENYQFEFDDKFVDRIISMAASELKINNEDASFQINKQQAIQKL